MNELSLEHMGRIVMIAAYALTAGIWAFIWFIKVRKRPATLRLHENADDLKK